ncbi:MAG: SPOR domain-containing protein [Azoarcus sp.]|nr:SPOR domain-containing protein [Azoarcus sp.]
MSDFPANETDDLEIKKRARRRLVGAAALALLAAVVLPLAMDDEAPLPVPDMQVTIPERGETLADDADANAGAASGAAGIDIEPDVDPGALPPLSGVSPAESRLPASPDAASAPPASDGSSRFAPADGKPATKSAADADSAEAARALALLSGAAPEKGRFFVQVGAFNDAVKAVALASELKQQGYPAFTVAGNKVTRVRVGPFSGRREGERIVARLKAEGRNAVLSSR